MALHITLKFLLLAATLGFAIDARVRLARAGLDERRHLRAMTWHVVGVTVLAVLLVAVGAGLRLVA